MRDKKLFEISVVTDDETGIYRVGEFDFGVPYDTPVWLTSNPERRKELAEYVRRLADCIEHAQTPFEARAEPAVVVREFKPDSSCPSCEQGVMMVADGKGVRFQHRDGSFECPFLPRSDR